MIATQSPDDALVEECGTCEQPRPHEVTIALLEENTESKNAAFSREPYRVTTCLTCGAETQTRMNNA